MNPDTHKFLEPVSHENPALKSVKISDDQFESILNIQQRILDSIALDHEETDILDELCRLSETLLGNSVASIMQLNSETNALKLISAPSLDEESQQRLQGVIPGKQNGSCAAAIHFGEASYVVDTLGDARWENSLSLAEDFNICSCWSMPVFNRDGDVIGTFALSSFEQRSPTTFHDHLLKICASTVSILLERKELRRLAMTDKLTKLCNRAKLDSILEEQYEKMDDPKHNYAVMLFDIDCFKNVNDTFGHNVGDTVLTELSEVLRNEVGTDGVVGRWGGEEFMVVLTKPHSHRAPEIAQRIRRAVQDHDFSTVRSVTVSVGVCVVSLKTSTLEVIDEADQALCQAKQHGRNCASVHYKNKPISLRVNY